MPKSKPVPAMFQDKNIVTEDSDLARELYNRSRYGEVKNRKVYLSFFEALFLLEKNKIIITDVRGRAYDYDRFVKKMKKGFLVKYAVFKDLRSRGYITKTALKFGADFRVYGKGIKPGEDHAKWVVFCVHESEKHTWKEFSAKNRVAHSTRKLLLLAVVDDELDISYWEVSWLRP
jgi:tRNA-intron endonuclease